MSLAASSIALAQNPKSQSAFFLPYSRAWELILGALLAYPLLQRLRQPLLEAAALSGLTMILIAVLSYSEETVFPGLSALLPCVGAALVIYAGQQGTTLGGRLLSMQGMLRIGKISYPLYLWHWPLLVFARAWLGDDLGAIAVASVILLSVVLAMLSTYLIERPFRGRQAVLTRLGVFRFAGAGILLFVLIGFLGMLSDGWAGRYPPEVASVLFSKQDRDPRQRECLNTKAENQGCVYGDRRAEPRVALWGDSHAAVYSVMLGDLAAAQGESLLVLTMPACPSVDGWALPEQIWRETCLDFQGEAMARILSSPSIRTVILSGRFIGYPIDMPDSGFDAALRRAIHKLRQGDKRVLVVYPVPEPGEDLPSTLGRALMSGEQLDERNTPVAEFHRKFAHVLAFLDELVLSEAIEAVRPSESLCDQERCKLYGDGIVYYYDEHHLSLSGAAQLKALFGHLF